MTGSRRDWSLLFIFRQGTVQTAVTGAPHKSMPTALAWALAWPLVGTEFSWYPFKASISIAGYARMFGGVSVKVATSLVLTGKCICSCIKEGFGIGRVRKCICSCIKKDFGIGRVEKCICSCIKEGFGTGRVDAKVWNKLRKHSEFLINIGWSESKSAR